MTQQATVQQKLKQHGFTDGETQNPSICTCDHKLIGTGAIFLRSMGILYCNECRGYQLIRGVIR